MEITKHFTIEEFTTSQTAARLGINNNMTTNALNNATLLCEKVLEPLRDNLNRAPIIISSGYRCEELNKAIGGSSRSQHITGQAADIIVPGYSNVFLTEIIAKLKKDKILEFDQLIEEFGQWMHISYHLNHNRNTILKATIKNGVVTYDNITRYYEL